MLNTQGDFCTNIFWNKVSLNFKVMGGISLKTTFVRSYIYDDDVPFEGNLNIILLWILLQFIQAEKSLTADTWKRYPL